MTELLASLEDFAAVRGVDFDPTDEQAIIALEGASGLVAQELNGRVFSLVEDVVTLPGSATRGLLLPGPPVVSVSEIVEVCGTDERTLTSGTDYVLEDAEAGIVRFAFPTVGWGVSPWSGVLYRVTYTHGFDGAPPEVAMVVMALAGRLFVQGASGGQVIRQEQIGTYLVAYETGGSSSGEGLTDLERRVLARYALPRAA